MGLVEGRSVVPGGLLACGRTALRMLHKGFAKGPPLARESVVGYFDPVAQQRASALSLVGKAMASF